MVINYKLLCIVELYPKGCQEMIIVFSHMPSVLFLDQASYDLDMLAYFRCNILDYSFIRNLEHMFYKKQNFVYPHTDARACTHMYTCVLCMCAHACVYVHAHVCVCIYASNMYNC